MQSVDLGQYGIRVNCVSPHVVPTQMTRDLFKLEDGDEFPNVYSHFKCGDILKAENIAEAALYLASDASRFVSRHVLMEASLQQTKVFVLPIIKLKRRTTCFRLQVLS